MCTPVCENINNDCFHRGIFLFRFFFSLSFPHSHSHSLPYNPANEMMMVINQVPMAAVRKPAAVSRFCKKPSSPKHADSVGP